MIGAYMVDIDQNLNDNIENTVNELNHRDPYEGVDVTADPAGEDLDGSDAFN